MSKPLHIQFLELFKHKGIGQYVDIVDFVSEHYVHVGPVRFNNPLNENAPILFLQDLMSRGLIRPEHDEGEWVYVLRNGILTPEINTNDPVVVLYFYITSQGIDYLDQYYHTQVTAELNTSLKNVNTASVTNYKTQKRLAYLTLALAFVSAWMSWMAYNKTDETAKSVDRLRAELRQWRQLQEQQKAQITYPRVLRHK